MITLNENDDLEKLKLKIKEINDTFRDFEKIKEENESLKAEVQILKKDHKSELEKLKTELLNLKDGKTEPQNTNEETQTNLVIQNKNDKIIRLQNQLTDLNRKIEQLKNEQDLNLKKQETKTLIIIEERNKLKNELEDALLNITSLKSEKDQIEGIYKSHKLEVDKLNSLINTQQKEISSLKKKRRNLFYILLIVGLIIITEIILACFSTLCSANCNSEKFQTTKTRSDIHTPKPPIIRPPLSPINKYDYIIKVIAFRTESKAKTEVMKLRKLKYPSNYCLIASKNLYSVYIGPYSNYTKRNQDFIQVLKYKPSARLDSIKIPDTAAKK